MNREELLELQRQGKPCYYTGRVTRLQGQPLYIKHVYHKRAVVTSTPLLSKVGHDSLHDIRLENLAPAIATDN